MIEITKRPYDINWSGNPIQYAFQSEEAKYDADITFELKVFFKSLEDGAAWKEICILPLTPINGAASIDIAEILRAQLDFVLPELSANGSSSGKQTGYFYIEYRQFNIRTTAQESWIASEVENIRVVVMGGIHPFQWKGNNYWINYYPEKKPFLTWQQNTLVSLTERLYLFWINITDVQAGNIAAIATCTYTDSSTIKKTVSVESLKYRISHIPVGAAQLQLQSPGKTIWFWDVALYDIGNPDAPVKITETIRYFHDQRNDYNQVTFHFRNSLGGFDSCRIRGVIETTISLEGSDAETIEAYQEGRNYLPRMDRSLPHREMATYKGEMGHLDKQQQDRLRDAFLSRDVWMEKQGRWWPVKLLTKQFKLRASNDKRFSLPFDWMIADGGSFSYTPEIDLGDGILINSVCNATIQNVQHTLVYFAGGTACTTKYTFQVVSPSGENIRKIQYRVPGLVEDWTDFDFPYSNPLETNHAVPSSHSIYMRALCNDGSAGPVTLHQVDIPAQGSAPSVYNSNLYNDGTISTPYTVEINGMAVASGSVQAGGYVSFNADNANGATVILTLGYVNPDSGTIKSNGITKLGSIFNKQITFANVNILNGLIINFT